MKPDDDKADEALDISDLEKYATDSAQQIEESNTLVSYASSLFPSAMTIRPVFSLNPHADIMRPYADTT